jgi:hypothetical protein
VVISHLGTLGEEIMGKYKETFFDHISRDKVPIVNWVILNVELQRLA